MRAEFYPFPTKSKLKNLGGSGAKGNHICVRLSHNYAVYRTFPNVANRAGWSIVYKPGMLSSQHIFVKFYKCLNGLKLVF